MMMNKADAIAKLKSYADAIKAMGATSLYLYGSQRATKRRRQAISIYLSITMSKGVSTRSI